MALSILLLKKAALVAGSTIPRAKVVKYALTPSTCRWLKNCLHKLILYTAEEILVNPLLLRSISIDSEVAAEYLCQRSILIEEKITVAVEAFGPVVLEVAVANDPTL